MKDVLSQVDRDTIVEAENGGKKMAPTAHLPGPEQAEERPGLLRQPGGFCRQWLQAEG